MYLFSGKIKCQNCGKNFKGITERGKKKYICAGYANYGKDFCTRLKIDEEKLIYLVNTHIEIQKLKRGIKLGESRRRGRPKKKEENRNTIDLSYIQKYTKVIKVYPKEEVIEIYYQDNTKTYISPNRHIF